MKKLSLLIALLLVVTIGGVYATRTYTSDAVDVTDGTVQSGGSEIVAYRTNLEKTDK